MMFDTRFSSFIPIPVKEIVKMDDKMITEYELSEWLSVSKSTLFKLRESGQIPFQLIGNSIRYSRRDIEEWLSTNSFNRTTEGEENE
jgi:excisionase family DNA binding protein